MSAGFIAVDLRDCALSWPVTPAKAGVQRIWRRPGSRMGGNETNGALFRVRSLIQ